MTDCVDTVSRGWLRVIFRRVSAAITHRITLRCLLGTLLGIAAGGIGGYAYALRYGPYSPPRLGMTLDGFSRAVELASTQVLDYYFSYQAPAATFDIYPQERNSLGQEQMRRQAQWAFRSGRTVTGGRDRGLGSLYLFGFNPARPAEAASLFLSWRGDTSFIGYQRRPLEDGSAPTQDLTADQALAVALQVADQEGIYTWELWTCSIARDYWGSWVISFGIGDTAIGYGERQAIVMVHPGGEVTFAGFKADADAVASCRRTHWTKGKPPAELLPADQALRLALAAGGWEDRFESLDFCLNFGPMPDGDSWSFRAGRHAIRVYNDGSIERYID